MKNLILLFISLSALSCSHYVINNEGYTRPPERYKFSYKNKKLNKDVYKKIDTTAIYYLEEQNLYKHDSEYKRHGVYIRFYSNGRFKLQGVKKFPAIEEVNNINKGIVGYFYLKENVIKLQIYGDINGGSDQLEFGIIEENGDLNILDENPRTTYCIGYSEKSIRRKIEKSAFTPVIYRKIHLENLVYDEPNW